MEKNVIADRALVLYDDMLNLVRLMTKDTLCILHMRNMLALMAFDSSEMFCT